jgi:hypothetical protein
MEEQNYEELPELKYEEIPEIKKRLKETIREIGVTTESQNRLPIFEPSNKPREGVRVFEGKYGRLTVKGRLGQPHKNLLEVILWKKELHDYFKDGKSKYLKVLYDEEKIRRYLSQKSIYSYERYRILLEDMIRTVITLETEKLKTQGTLIMQIDESPVLKPVKSRSPIIPKQVPLVTIKFGAVATALIENELKFTYDPKPIMQLRSGISQAIVRYLRTHKDHPPAGYHLRALLENLEKQMEDKKWWEIRRYLKEDAEKLEELGIVINFKEDRLFVIDKT